MAQVLALDAGGIPQHWISFEQAIIHHAKGMVAWSAGEEFVTYHGGYRRIDGVRSELSTTTIIAIKGQHAGAQSRKIQLTNRTLFARDHHVCAYCGKYFADDLKLSRDHVVPISHGGKDVWTNCVTSCIRCNNVKADQSLEVAGLELLYVPYVPNIYEAMILKNRKILHDQMMFLLQGVPEHSRMHQHVGK